MAAVSKPQGGEGKSQSAKRVRTDETTIPLMVNAPDVDLDLDTLLKSMSDTGFLLDHTRRAINLVATLLLRADMGETRIETFTEDVLGGLGKMAQALEPGEEPLASNGAGQTGQKQQETSAIKYTEGDLARLGGYVGQARALAKVVAGEVLAAEKIVGEGTMAEVKALREQLEMFGSGKISERSVKILESLKPTSDEPMQKRAKLDDSAAEKERALTDMEEGLTQFVNCNRTSVKSLQDGILQVRSISTNYYAPPAAALLAPAKGPAAGLPPLVQKVFFITNRKFDAKVNSYGTDDQDSLEFGTTSVSIPQILSDDKLRQDGDKVKAHVSSEDLKRQTHPDTLISEITNDLATAPRKEILFFIHGYNVSYSDAVGALGMLAKDIDFKAPVVALDWASRANLALYGSVPFLEDDKERVKSSALLFADILKKLINSLPGVEKVHILAHSMGNLLLQQLVEHLDKAPTPPEQHPFRKVHTLILAAPDVSIKEGQSVLSNVAKIKPPNVSGRRSMTVYCSTGDLALLASSVLQKGPRVGFYTNGWGGNHGSHPFYDDLVDTVEVLKSDIDSVGHSYYSYDLGVIHDIETLVKSGGEGNQRFKATKCKSNPLCKIKLFRVPTVENKK